MNEQKVLRYETNPCEECDYCRSLCDHDFEYCQIHGAPTSKLFSDILDERDQQLNIPSTGKRWRNERCMRN